MSLNNLYMPTIRVVVCACVVTTWVSCCLSTDPTSTAADQEMYAIRQQLEAKKRFCDLSYYEVHSLLIVQDHRVVR